MDASFWQERWREGRIGFHEGKPNTFLERHLARLGPSRRVLVPLCGKAEDLAYLAAAGHQVLGVELVEDAVRAFFSEHGIEPVVARRGEHVIYTAGPLTIIAGDFFTVTPALAGPLDAIYDRAALVALPEAMRRRYVQQARELAALPALVVTFEYDQATMEGPPFSIPEAEVRSYYVGAHVELVDEQPDGRLRDRGAVAMERCWLVTDRPTQKSES